MVVAWRFKCCYGIFVINFEQILSNAFTGLEVYSKTCQIYKTELLVKIGNSFLPIIA